MGAGYSTRRPEPNYILLATQSLLFASWKLKLTGSKEKPKYSERSDSNGREDTIRFFDRGVTSDRELYEDVGRILKLVSG